MLLHSLCTSSALLIYSGDTRDVNVNRPLRDCDAEAHTEAVIVTRRLRDAMKTFHDDLRSS